LDEADALLVFPQRFQDPIDAIAGKPENELHSLGDQSFDEYVRGGLLHAVN
jgi:hypothetical protein